MERLQNHTFHLLVLTACRIGPSNIMATPRFDLVLRCAPMIKDPRQRVRVYAKLGMLLQRIGQKRSGLKWGVRALFVRGVPLFVRAKAFAALLGIDR